LPKFPSVIDRTVDDKKEIHYLKEKLKEYYIRNKNLDAHLHETELRRDEMFTLYQELLQATKHVQDNGLKASLQDIVIELSQDAIQRYFDRKLASILRLEGSLSDARAEAIQLHAFVRFMRDKFYTTCEARPLFGYFGNTFAK